MELSRAARVIVITVKTVVKTAGKHMITVITGTISLYKYTPWGGYCIRRNSPVITVITRFIMVITPVITVITLFHTMPLNSPSGHLKLPSGNLTGVQLGLGIRLLGVWGPFGPLGPSAPWALWPRGPFGPLGPLALLCPLGPLAQRTLLF